MSVQVTDVIAVNSIVISCVLLETDPRDQPTIRPRRIRDGISLGIVLLEYEYNLPWYRVREGHNALMSKIEESKKSRGTAVSTKVRTHRTAQHYHR